MQANTIEPRKTLSPANKNKGPDNAAKIPANPKDPDSIQEVEEKLLRNFHQERQIFQSDFTVVNSSPNDSSVVSRFLTDANFRSVSISGLNAFLHALTVASSFSPENPLIKRLNHYCDRTAFAFTKILAPFVSFTMSAYSAIKNKKPIEAIIKMIPNALLPFVGDANVDSVFGMCFGLNQPYDILVDRLETKAKNSNEFRAKLNEANKSSAGNASIILEEIKNLFGDLKTGKLPWSQLGYIINCSMILLGSLPILLFARNDRNTAFAQALGFLRSTGGILGDALFVGQKANFHKFIVGILCSLGALSNITKRLVHNDALARVFIHLGAALDVAGYTVWNAWSDNKKPAAQAA